MPDDEIKVEQCDRELFITILNPCDSVAEMVRKGMSYTWEVEQIARHRIQHGAQGEPDLATIAYLSGAYDGRKDMEAQLAERDAEVARLREALVDHNDALRSAQRPR